MPAKRAPVEVESPDQLELFDEALTEPERDREEPLGAKDGLGRWHDDVGGLPTEPAESSEPAGGGPQAGGDRAVLKALEATLADARASADDRPALVVLASRFPRTRRPDGPAGGRRSLTSAGARRLAASARSPAEERERDRGVPGRDRRPARAIGSERAEHPRGGDDRRLPALVPAARGPCAGNLLPALSPPAQVPPVGEPT